MTNMDSSIFHKEENNESKTMDGRNRCGGHAVRGHDRTGRCHGRRDDRTGSLANFHDLRDQRQHHHGEGHGCGRVQDMERKDLFEQPHVQSGESRQLQDR